jgi:oleate hydratase
MVGGGIGSMAAAAFLVRDGGWSGADITIFESSPVLGGSLDAAGTPSSGYSMRGGRMLTTDNYECTWDVFKSITSLRDPSKTVFEETVEFNERIKAHSQARLVDRNRAIVDVTSMGFTMEDRLQLVRLAEASEVVLAASRITDWLHREHVHSTRQWRSPAAGTPDVQERGVRQSVCRDSRRRGVHG